MSKVTKIAKVAVCCLFFFVTMFLASSQAKALQFCVDEWYVGTLKFISVDEFGVVRHQYMTPGFDIEDDCDGYNCKAPIVCESGGIGSIGNIGNISVGGEKGTESDFCLTAEIGSKEACHMYLVHTCNNGPGSNTTQLIRNIIQHVNSNLCICPECQVGYWQLE